MDTATNELRKSHKVVRKVLREVNVGSARFSDVIKTLHRTLAAHAYFVDKIFIPGLKGVPLINKRFIQSVVDEHRDIEELIMTLRKTPLSRNKALDAYVLQIQIMIEANFLKEDNALYVLAENLLDSKSLRTLAEEMDRRKEEIRELVAK